MAAITNAEQLNYEKIGNDSQISPRTIKDYYQVLEDTLIGKRLAPYHPKPSRKFVATPKFYFFDPGVVSALLGRKELPVGTNDYGKAMEHLIYCELIAFKDYCLDEAELFYWRTHSQQEVDFVFVNGPQIIAIEVKSSVQFRREHSSGLNALQLEVPLSKRIVVNFEKMKRKTDDGILIYPLATFLKELWSGKIIQ
jgi:predicted AAA+ superfamily ATPase